ncbi:HNH endonuclease (plasmid) [Klebsiella pneumoniae subsp. pneumoniae]
MFAPSLESVGKRVKIELHHEKEISQGGAVMDVDNIKALTPKNHIETHKGK